MYISFRRLFRFASIASCLILVACSGGGGGGSGGSSSGTLILSTNVLTFSASNTNTTPPSQIITATVTGVTSGTLYIKIVSVGPAVASITNIVVTGTTTGQGTINPATAATLGPGLHTSTITVYACTTDPDCSSGQLTGSPQTVNVNYTVVGLNASPSSLNYTVGDAYEDSDLIRQFTVSGYPIQNWTAVGNKPWLFVSTMSGNTTNATEVIVRLVDNELDNMASGTYTGEITVTPTSGSAVTISITLTKLRDPHMEPGFPVKTYRTTGSYWTGPESIFITAGNIDSDPELEIVVTATAAGPLWAFNHDGTLLNGWPEEYGLAVGYPSMGNFFADAGQLEVAVGYFAFSEASCNDDRFIFNGGGQPLPGWPQTSCNAGHAEPPQIIDIDGDGLDEIFYKQNSIVAYRADGQVLSGWPPNYNESSYMAFGDVDGDSVDEVISASHSQIMAFKFDGSTVTGFPFPTFPNTDNSKILVSPILTADINGNGRFDIIEVRKEQNNPSRTGDLAGRGCVLHDRTRTS
jgi:hypothetical protein